MTAPAGESLDGCEARYARHACLWGRAHDRLAELVAAHLDLRGAELLDLGCGEGRNAVFLAERGARVRALDVSARALANARRAWPESGVRWEHGDVRELPLEAGSLDIVLACSVLQWLGDERVIDSVVAKMREATRAGGVNALAVFNDRRPYAPPRGERARPCLLPHAWYLERYAGWTILEASDRIGSSPGHRGHPEPHEHAVTQLLARRPGP